MEKSNNETEKQGSKDEGENQRDDQPTTSRGENNPERNSHNMNDFKSLDFNSADEVRQAMKAILTGQVPPQSFPEDDNNKIKGQNKSEPAGMNQLGSNTPNYEFRKNVPRPVQQNLNLKIMTAAQTYTGDTFQFSGGSSDLNRRRKSMKAGPSKSVKRPIKSLYIGKLSNVVQFKRRRWASETGSDADSVIYY